MTLSLALQYGAIVVAALASLAFVARRQFPAAFRQARLSLAAWLLRESRPDVLRRIGRRIAPPALSIAGCGGCDGCGKGE